VTAEPSLTRGDAVLQREREFIDDLGAVSKRRSGCAALIFFSVLEQDGEQLQSITFLTMSGPLASSLSRSSVSAVAADTSSRKSSSSERSRNRYSGFAGSGHFFGQPGFQYGRFQDFYRLRWRRCGSRRRRHISTSSQRADAARRLTPMSGPTTRRIRRDVVRGRAAGTENPSTSHEIRSGNLASVQAVAFWLSSSSAVQNYLPQWRRLDG